MRELGPKKVFSEVDIINCLHEPLDYIYELGAILNSCKCRYGTCPHKCSCSSLFSLCVWSGMDIWV